MTGDFSVLIGIGAALGLLQVARAAPPKDALHWVDAGLFALLGSLIGARAWYVALHLSYFRLHPLEAPQVWLGGISWPGAALGGLLVAALVAYIDELPLSTALGRLSGLAVPLAAAAWLGAWRSGSAYGPLLPEGSRLAMLAPMEDGLFTPRLPVQLLATLSLLIALIWFELHPQMLERLDRKAAVTGLVLAAHTLVFSLLRADPTPLWRGLRPDVWAALAFMALAALALAALFLPIHRKESGESSQSVGGTTQF